MRPTIHPATLRDASYVMANLNADDAAEVDCQVPEGAIRHEMAYGLLMSGDNFAVREGDQPIAFFGTAPMSCCYLSLWALGTKRMWRAVGPLTRFMIDVHLPERIAQGYIGMEARCMVGHPTAHAWLDAIGGEPSGEPFEFGRNRELFTTYRWTASDIEAQRRLARR